LNHTGTGLLPLMLSLRLMSDEFTAMGVLMGRYVGQQASAGALALRSVPRPQRRPALGGSVEGLNVARAAPQTFCV